MQYIVIDSNEPNWQDKLKKEIAKHKVVLSDIFDTLITREFRGNKVTYHKIFELIDSQLQPYNLESYKEARIEAGHKARDLSPYYDLSHVMQRLPLKFYSLPPLEYKIDAKLIKPTDIGKVVLDCCKYLKHKYLLTDTYYSTEQVYYLLHQAYHPNAIASWGLLNSAEDHVAKADGTMYDQVLYLLNGGKSWTPESLQGSDCVMLSDRIQELELAEKYKINCILVKTQVGREEYYGNTNT